MICGFPDGVDSPVRTHSFVSELMNSAPYGGLVDGPIYRSRFESLRGIHLKYDDHYAPFQFGAAVYHDDPGDYSSNEPTMDGTASLSFFLSTLQKEGQRQQRALNAVTDSQGAVVRLDPSQKTVHLIFSADMAFEGAEHILNTLKKNRIKASFFLTGNCLRKPEYAAVIRRIIKEGHYLGGHSDRHLLYAAWGNRQQTLVSADSLYADLQSNMAELQRFGVSQAPYFLPPYEYYNLKTTSLLAAKGYVTVNFTSGLRTAADYTTPDMASYMTSDKLIEQLYSFEKENTLNGAIILIHPGTEASRADKLYLRLHEIISALRSKGYSFARFQSQ
jgi:peptidoglycan/xylan/chitin deacetylase (PgdA/CDA1 family)